MNSDETTPATPTPTPSEPTVQEQMDLIAEKMEAEIRKLTTPAPGSERPTVAMTPGRVSALVHMKVRLRCESILQMAMQVWMQEMRGAMPMWGPADAWKLNEMKRILFSVEEKNHDF